MAQITRQHPNRKFCAKPIHAYLFHRELYGENCGITRPPFSPKYQQLHITDLDNEHINLKRYIIIGERPTYPYHVITVRKADIRPPYDLITWINTEEEAFTDGTGGGLVYWTIDRRKNHYGQEVVTLEKPLIQTAAERGFDSTDKILEAVFTVWDLKEDCCAQVLGWKGYHDFAAVQFRYGNRSFVVETPEKQLSLYGACFAGLNSKLAIGKCTVRTGAVISAIGQAAVYFFEPFGQNSGVAPGKSYWYTVPEASHGVGVKSDSMRVSVLRLDLYIKKFLKEKLQDSFKNKDPDLHNFCSNYLHEHQATIHNTHYKTVVAIGTFEKVTRLYFFALLIVDHIDRSVKPLVARSLTSDEPGNPFRFPEHSSASALTDSFVTAADRVVGPGRVRSPIIAHRCAYVGDEMPANVIRPLHIYQSWSSSIENIRLEQAGILLQGWFPQLAIGDLELE